MKKVLAAAWCFLLVLALAGCGSQKEKVKNVSYNGVDYVVDTENGTISDGKRVYTYVYGSSGGTITYPDGNYYTWKEINGAVTGSSSLGFDDTSHVDPWVLRAVIGEAEQTNSTSGRKHVGVGIILLVVGIVSAVWPDKIWYLNWGWRYKDAEPSDMALTLNRIGGVIAAVIGLVLIIV